MFTYNFPIHLDKVPLPQSQSPAAILPRNTRMFASLHLIESMWFLQWEFSFLWAKTDFEFVKTQFRICDNAESYRMLFFCL